MQEVMVLDDGNFNSEVANSQMPIAVDFWAEWCGPCRTLAPIFAEAASEVSEKVKVAKLNVDANPVTAARYGIQSIPTILAFKAGEIVSRSVGVRSKQELVDWLKGL